jgi:hypothetical protein
MERLRTHEEIQELLGAYALDAVEPEDAAEIERHLAVCPRCRAEVADHREVAGFLGYAGADAPPGLWDRIQVNLSEPPPALRLTRVGTDAGSPAGAGAGAGAAAGADGGLAEVVPLGRRAISFRAFATMAAVAAVVAGILGVQVIRLDNRTNGLTRNAGVSTVAAAYTAAAANPGARRVSMTSADGTSRVDAVILPDGTAFFHPDRLPALPTNQTYQLWGVIGTTRVSLAVIGSTPRINEFGAPDKVTALAVTAESAGGVAISSNVPVVSGLVPPPVTG